MSQTHPPGSHAHAHEHSHEHASHDHRAAVMEEAQRSVIRVSLIGASAVLRVAVAAALAAVIWFLAFWAMR